MVLMLELARIRQHRDLKWATLSKVTGINWEHLKHLESLDPKRKTEAWFDEALIISRALCTGGIWPLITAGPIKDVDLGRTLPDNLDLLMFRSGGRIKLSVACRVSRILGLADPVELVQPFHGLANELWRVISTNERNAAPGNCRWCNQPIVGDAGHLPTCLPDQIWGRRGEEMAPRIKALVPPERRGVGRPVSSPAWGLAAIRDQLGLTQAEMAAKLGFKASSHYAQIERGEVKVRLDKADVFAVILGVDRHDIMRKSVEQAQAQSVSGDLT